MGELDGLNHRRSRVILVRRCRDGIRVRGQCFGFSSRRLGISSYTVTAMNHMLQSSESWLQASCKAVFPRYSLAMETECQQQVSDIKPKQSETNQSSILSSIHRPHTRNANPSSFNNPAPDALLQEQDHQHPPRLLPHNLVLT